MPLLVRAMVLADQTLYLAGPPDVVNEQQASERLTDTGIRAKLAEQVAAFEGRKGARLWAVAAEDGKKLTECELTSVPVFDGLAAANGRLYLVTMDGKVLCLVGRK